jgi:3-mercaptopyruvate sulfurtransferase SseA
MSSNIFCARALSLMALLAGLLTGWLLPAAKAWAGPATAVSADDAHTALAQGAYALDVRAPEAYRAGHLPQASLLPQDAAQRPLNALADLLTQAGADSSRTIVVVGDAGDAHAHALWQRLAQVAPGRVLWLVGGVQEWQMRGFSLSTEPVKRLPVPQMLVPFSAETPSAAPAMAGSRVRSGGALERAWPVKIALQ